MFRTVFPLLPMFALLIWAAISDFRTRRIPNWLTLALALSGICNSFLKTAATTPAQAGLGLLVGFAIPFVLYRLGALGGADVKMMAGIGAWLGLVAVLKILIIEKIVGLVIVLVQCAWQGRLLVLFRNSAVLAVNLVNIQQLGAEHVSETGKSCRSVDRPLPYAVPVLIATLVVVTLM
jgi:prepilin peptidase CpaA